MYKQPFTPYCSTIVQGYSNKEGVSALSLSLPQYMMIGGDDIHNFVVSSNNGDEWYGGANYNPNFRPNKIVKSPDGKALIFAQGKVYSTLDGRLYNDVFTSSSSGSGNNNASVIMFPNSNIYVGQNSYSPIRISNLAIYNSNTNPQKYAASAGRGNKAFRTANDGSSQYSSNSGDSWGSVYYIGFLVKLLYASNSVWGIIQSGVGLPNKYTLNDVPNDSASWVSGSVINDDVSSTESNYAYDGVSKVIITTLTDSKLLVSADDGKTFNSTVTNVPGRIYTIKYVNEKWYVLNYFSGISTIYSSDDGVVYTPVASFTGHAYDFLVNS